LLPDFAPLRTEDAHRKSRKTSETLTVNQCARGRSYVMQSAPFALTAHDEANSEVAQTSGDDEADPA
jgi:hypothetical protein